MLNGYGDNDARKIWSSCGSTYSTCSTWRVIFTVRMSVVELLAKPNHTKATLQCKVLGILWMIFMKETRHFLNVFVTRISIRC
jgi:hypothetical protein